MLKKKFLVEIIGIIIILGGILFFLLDFILGEKQKTKERLTVIDTYTELIGGKFPIKKFCVKVNTKEGEEIIYVTYEQFDKIEKNDEIEVTITTVHTKWTDSTKFIYSIEN